MAKTTEDVAEPDTTQVASPPRKTWRFWAIIVSLCLMTFVSGLDATVLAISLPKVAAQLQLGNKYIFVYTSFWLAQTVFQPLCAQLSDVYGRKIPTMVSIVVFAVGGIVSGSARSSVALIAGRAVQGLGSGGILVLMEIIVCDIVSLRERGKYVSLVFSTAAVGAVIGPPVGGAIAEINWRWIFYINVILSGVGFVMIGIIMNLKYVKLTRTDAVSRIDWVGSAIFIASTSSLLLALGTGGTLHPWDSWRILLPLILGVCGLVAFHFFERSPYCATPIMPPHLFKHRTSLAAFAMSMIFSTLHTWLGFAWPVYFQAELRLSPLKAGINYLAFQAFLVTSAGISGTLLSKFGYYRPIQFFGFSFLTLAMGLGILLSPDTSTAEWVVILAVAAIGLASVMTTILPAALAPLSEADVALATGVFSLLSSFGFMWGATFSAIVFNTSFDRFSHDIHDQTVRALFGRGQAYQFISSPYIDSLPEQIKSEVIGVFDSALTVVWEAGVAIGTCGILLVFLEKHVPLRESLETQYGLEDRPREEEAAAIRNNAA